MTDLRHQVQVRRKRLDLTISELARRSGYDQGGLSRFLNGKHKSLSHDWLPAFANALDCTVGELMGEAPAAPQPAEPEANGVRLIPLDELHPSRLNEVLRPAGYDDLDDLARSIAQRGILQNLVVRAVNYGRAFNGEPDIRFEIIAGHRRYYAALVAQKNGRLPKDFAAPCRVVEADDTEHLVLAITENLQRVNPSPLAEATAFDTLCRAGLSTAEIAKRIKLTQRFVQLRVALVRQLDPKVQAALSAERMTLAHARLLTQLERGDQKELLQRIHRGEFPRADDLQAELRRRDEAAQAAACQDPLFTDPQPIPPSAAGQPARPGQPPAQDVDPAHARTSGRPAAPAPPSPKRIGVTPKPEPRRRSTAFEPDAVPLKPRIVQTFGDPAMPEQLVLYDPDTKLMSTYRRDPREDQVLGG